MMMERPATLLEPGRSQRPAIPQAPWCLFLDVDGTLLDIAATPDAVRVDAVLVDLLRRPGRASGGALALVTGRPIHMTDLDGFAAVRRLDGLAIAVGTRLPGKQRRSGPPDVRAWPAILLGKSGG